MLGLIRGYQNYEMLDVGHQNYEMLDVGYQNYEMLNVASHLPLLRKANFRDINE